MNLVWLSLLVVSALLLVGIIVKRRLSWSWLKRFSIHLTVAAVALYLLNYSGFISGFYIPLNPATIAVVVALGLPGIGMILGLQWLVI
ncbi:pro-sigmaK processing inhibitor BofA family protein [Paenibacillus daejeonensis]|uniref:pro-sigmaK processing inhibitor BofA family protein n=1 Tax=Paenibacillus daejeonensis TaxID=135193 RepID=UPI000367B6E3|nr:pro-sigmaK processing inhibitor BofA family protein [Paenibacillus daejeonensis]